jgi:ATP-binding cassette subfamily F protein uup
VASKPKKKLSYKEQRELDELPARIEALEEEQTELNKTLADPDLYRKQDAHSIAGLQARIATIDDELLVLLERWETLGGA